MKLADLKCDSKEKVSTVMLKSVKKLGIIHHLLVTKDGKVVDGKKRYLAAKKLKLEEVPVHIITDEDALMFALLAPRSTPMTKEDLSKTIKKCLEEVTIQELAVKLNRSVRTIKRWRDAC